MAEGGRMREPEDWQSGKSLTESTGHMLDNEIETDVTFVLTSLVPPVSVKAHRFMLVARSQTFQRLLSGKEANHVINLPGIDADTFREFLRYLYTDTTSISIDKAIRLTKCAVDYGVTSLKSMCMDYLQRKVNKVTVFDLLGHALNFKNEDLAQTCLIFLKKSKNSMELLEHQHLHIKALDLFLMKYKDLGLSEVELFKYCIKWAEKECKFKEIDTTPEELRKVLEPTVDKIPFSGMTQSQLQLEVISQNKGFLTQEEIISILDSIKTREEKGSLDIAARVTPSTRKSGITGKNTRKEAEILTGLPEVETPEGSPTGNSQRPRRKSSLMWRQQDMANFRAAVDNDE